MDMKRKSRFTCPSYFYVMRFSSFILLFGLIGACSNEEPTCEGWKYVGPVDSIERFSSLFADTRTTLSVDEIDIFQNADFCEPPLSPSPGIYRIEGDVYENCQGKFCVEITKWLKPYCIPELIVRDSQEEVFGEWQISHISTTDTLYYPDCNYGSFWINSSDSINYADLNLGGMWIQHAGLI
jgi:hypothetical protein